jgi:hypothetical protein
MRYSKIGFCSVFLLLLAVQAVTANEIVVEGDGNPSYLTFVGSAPNGISAFGIEIQYSSGTQITAVESVEPFEVASGSDAVNGTIKIGGYAPQDSQIAVSGQIRLAKIWSAHVIEGVVIVDYLEDFQRSPVQVSNQVYLSPTPVKISVPVYAPPVTYNSSGAVQTNPTDYISAPETVTTSSPDPQVSASGTPSATGNVRDGTGTQTPSPGIVPPTEHSEVITAGEPAISPTKAPLMLCTPFCAIFSALLLLIKRKGEKTL